MINVTINCNPSEWGQHGRYQYIDTRRLKIIKRLFVHNDQLVNSNCQNIALTLFFARFKIWLLHKCHIEEDYLNIKIVTALLLDNACTLLNMMEICVTNNNKLKIHPRGMATFLKNKKT